MKDANCIIPAGQHEAMKYKGADESAPLQMPVL
jgi:hypothetical protein